VREGRGEGGEKRLFSLIYKELVLKKHVISSEREKELGGTPKRKKQN